MSILKHLLKGTIQVAKTAAVQHARSAAAPAAKRKSKGADCTPCAAKKTAAKMWNQSDKMMGWK